jgi:hypothetical protein
MIENARHMNVNIKCTVRSKEFVRESVTGQTKSFFGTFVVLKIFITSCSHAKVDQMLIKVSKYNNVC